MGSTTPESPKGHVISNLVDRTLQRHRERHRESHLGIDVSINVSMDRPTTPANQSSPDVPTLANTNVESQVAAPNVALINPATPEKQKTPHLLNPFNSPPFPSKLADEILKNVIVEDLLDILPPSLRDLVVRCAVSYGCRPPSHVYYQPTKSEIISRLQPRPDATVNYILDEATRVVIAHWAHKYRVVIYHYRERMHCDAMEDALAAGEEAKPAVLATAEARMKTLAEQKPGTTIDALTEILNRSFTGEPSSHQKSPAASHVSFDSLGGAGQSPSPREESPMKSPPPAEEGSPEICPSPTRPHAPRSPRVRGTTRLVPVPLGPTHLLSPGSQRRGRASARPGAPSSSPSKSLFKGWSPGKGQTIGGLRSYDVFSPGRRAASPSPYEMDAEE